MDNVCLYVHNMSLLCFLYDAWLQWCCAEATDDNTLPMYSDPPPAYDDESVNVSPLCTVQLPSVLDTAQGLKQTGLFQTRFVPELAT